MVAPTPYENPAPYRIEKNIPAPLPRGRRIVMPEGFKKTSFTATVEKLEIGDSFVCPWRDTNGYNGCDVSSRAAMWARNHSKDWKFRTQRLEAGVRVWRVA